MGQTFQLKQDRIAYFTLGGVVYSVKNPCNYYNCTSSQIASDFRKRGGKINDEAAAELRDNTAREIQTFCTFLITFVFRQPIF